MNKAEFMYEKTFLAEIKEKNIEGAVKESGIFARRRRHVA
jgi:hypothetical protein